MKHSKLILWLLLPLMALVAACGDDSENGGGSGGSLSGSWIMDAKYQGNAAYCLLSFRGSNAGTVIIINKSSGAVNYSEFTYEYQNRSRTLTISGSNVLAGSYSVQASSSAIKLVSEETERTFQKATVVNKDLLQKNPWRIMGDNGYYLWEFRTATTGRQLYVYNGIGKSSKPFNYTFDNETTVLNLTYNDGANEIFIASASIEEQLYLFYYDNIAKGYAYMKFEPYNGDMPESDLDLQQDDQQESLAKKIQGKWYQYNKNSSSQYYYYMVSFKPNDQYRIVTRNTSTGSVSYGAYTYSTQTRTSQITFSSDSPDAGTYTVSVDGTTLTLQAADGTKYSYKKAEETSYALLQKKTYWQLTSGSANYRFYFKTNNEGYWRVYNGSTMQEEKPFTYEYDSTYDKLTISELGTIDDTAYLGNYLLLFMNNGESYLEMK